MSLHAAPSPIDVVLEIIDVSEGDLSRPRKYLVRRKRGNFTPVDFAWDDKLNVALDELRKPKPDRVKLEEIGRLLPTFLADSTADDILSASSDTPVRITIRLQSVSPEIASLPWELLQLGVGGPRLVSLRNCLLRYEWQGTETTPWRSGPRIERGRILFAYSNAGGLGVPFKDHRESIKKACEAGRLEFDKRDELANMPFSALSKKLKQASMDRRGPYSILHILCHGAPLDSETEAYGLAWELNEKGEPVVITPRDMADTLRQYKETLRMVVLCVCQSGHAGAPGNPMGSTAERIHGAGISAVIASRLPLTVEGSKMFTGLLYKKLLGEPMSVEEAFREARNELRDELVHKTVDYASIQLWGREREGWDTRPAVFQPYGVCSPSEGADARFFVGREEEIERALEKLDALVTAKRPKFLLVTGASGVGKSSLVSAGLVPQLKERELRVVEVNSRSTRLGEGWREELDAKLISTTPQGGADEGEVVLAIDDLEDILETTKDPSVHQAFVRELWDRVSAPSSGLRVIAALRSGAVEWRGAILLDERSGESLGTLAVDEAHHVFVDKMTLEQLERVVTEPARRAGVKLNPTLASRIVHEIGEGPGALPLMAYVLRQRWSQGDGRSVTLDDGGNTLSSAADQRRIVANELSRLVTDAIAKLDGEQRRVARRLLMDLVRFGGGRSLNISERVEYARLRRKYARRRDDFDEMVKVLVNGRILVEEKAGKGAVTIELACDALIRPWPGLDDWVSDGQARTVELERLERLMKEQEEGETLLNAGQIGYVEGIVAKYEEDIGDEVLHLLERSREAVRLAAEQARRSRDALRVIMAQKHLDQPEPSAWDRTMAAALLREVEDDPANVRDWKSSAEKLTAQGVASRVWLCAELNEHAGAIRSIAFSPRGDRIATVSGDKTLVWSVGSGHVLRLDGHTKPVTVAGFDAGGERIVTASEDGTVLLWDIALSKDGAAAARGQGRGRILERHPGGDDEPVIAAGFARDGGQVVAAWRDGTACVWHTDSGQIVERLDGPKVFLRSAALDPIQGGVVMVSVSGKALVWNPARDAVPRELAAGSAPLILAAFSPDGRRILAASRDGTPWEWDADSGDQIDRSRDGEPPSSSLRDDEHEDLVSIMGSAKGSRVITAQQRGAAHVWSAEKINRTTEALSQVVAPIQSLAEEIAKWPPHRLVEQARRAAADPTRAIADASDRLQPAKDALSSLRGKLESDVRDWWLLLFADHRTLHREQMERLLKSEEAEYLKRRWSSTVDAQDASGVSGPDPARPSRSDRPPVSHRPIDRAAQAVQRAMAGLPAQVVSAATHIYVFTQSVTEMRKGLKLLSILVGHKDQVDCAVLSSDGDRVVTVSKDGSARLWRVQDGGCIAVFEGSGAGVISAAISPDGTQVITASRGGVVRLFRLDAPPMPALRGDAASARELRDWLWGEIPFCLSVEQRMQLLNEESRIAEENRDRSRKRVEASRRTPRSVAGPWVTSHPQREEHGLALAGQENSGGTTES